MQRRTLPTPPISVALPVENSDASAQLHPHADDEGDNPAERTPDVPAPKKGRGRPKLPPGQKGKYTRKGSAPAVASTENEAAAAVTAGVESRRQRDRDRKNDGPRAAPVGREKGWLRKLIEEKTDSTGRAVSQIRHLALSVLEREGLPWAQEVLADPTAKDSDKGRAVDLLAKLSAGYVTPDMAGSEDVPELPPPIFELSEGDLPGEGMTGSLSEEDTGADEDAGGPQLTSSAAPVGSTQSAGPVPHMGAA